MRRLHVQFKGKDTQRGVVLILALLIVALVTTVVVSVSWRFNLSVVRNMNRWHGAQARVHLEAAEQFALWGLREDAKNGKVDSLREQWAQPVNSPSPLGMISGLMEDAHGRLNLNLMKADPQPANREQQKPWEERLSLTQRMFIRFLQMIELEEGARIDQSQAIELTAAIEDWIDNDNNPTGYGGAENSYYESQDPPIYITNGEMTSVSELAMVKGMTQELYKKLEPFVIALPGYSDPAAAVKMNINTLKPELLRTLNNKDNFEPLDEATFELLRTVRDSANAEDPLQPGFRDVNEFINSPELSGIWMGMPENGPFKADDFVVSSSYFLLFAQVSIEDLTTGAGDDGRVVRNAKSILYRPSTEGAAQGQMPKVVRRTDAGF